MSDRRNGEGTVSVCREQAHGNDEISIRTKSTPQLRPRRTYSAVDMIVTERTRTTKALVRATCFCAPKATRRGE